MALYILRQQSAWWAYWKISNDKMTLDFKEEGDIIFLVGKSNNDINSSEYLHKIHGVEFSPAPHFDLEEEFALQQKLAS